MLKIFEKLSLNFQMAPHQEFFIDYLFWTAWETQKTTGKALDP